MQRNKTKLLPLISLLLTTLALLLTLPTIIFSAVTTNRLSASNSTGTLDSWTCKWQSYSADVTPGEFSRVCEMGSAGFDVLVLGLVVQVVSLGVGGWSKVVAGRLGRAEVGRGVSKVELVGV